MTDEDRLHVFRVSLDRDGRGFAKEYDGELELYDWRLLPISPNDEYLQGHVLAFDKYHAVDIGNAEREKLITAGYWVNGGTNESTTR